MREWLKRKPDNVVFTRIAVAFDANWEPSACAYYAAEALGVLETRCINRRSTPYHRESAS
ncbi:MAG: hypothetical protein IPL59_25295 [Candidatus Competibacteraceae bacterium]|nr:hypothetical protein [Candidatus Competibacteraceae bacterium]